MSVPHPSQAADVTCEPCSHSFLPARTIESQARSVLDVALLTGGNDRPYALGIAGALAQQGIRVDFICSDALEDPSLHTWPLLRVLNLRGDQREDVSLWRKARRITAYYARLAAYAATSRAGIFHILWNNKFELLDRTLLMLYYRALGKRIVLTAHNVNAAKRDGRDTWLNRTTLRIQYRLCSRIFVHTELMKRQISAEFGVREADVAVIPFGINKTIPATALTASAARARLGIEDEAVTLLFFGQIAAYKGLEYLVGAFDSVASKHENLRLVVAGKVKRGHEKYWDEIRRAIASCRAEARILLRIGFIPDEEAESYFKAADAVVLPYTDIFQSGVPFLAYGFGLPVIATDVGSLREDVAEGLSGFLCRPRSSAALAGAIERFLGSDLHRQPGRTRTTIKHWAERRHSWDIVGAVTRSAYDSLVERRR